jgi:RNA polymerase sigma-70 factor, ECF subfamily
LDFSSHSSNKPLQGFSGSGLAIADEVLVQMIAQEQSQLAMTTLFDRYFAKLVFFANRYTGNEDASKDVVQECFIKLIEASKTFITTNRFSTWMYTIVRNAAISACRKEQKQSQLKFDLPQNTFTQIHSTIDAKQAQQQLSIFLNTLCHKEQLIYELKINQQLSIKEIAEIADIPEGSVKSCLFYLLKKLNTQLKHLKDA